MPDKSTQPPGFDYKLLNTASVILVTSGHDDEPTKDEELGALSFPQWTGGLIVVLVVFFLCFVLFASFRKPFKIKK